MKPEALFNFDMSKMMADFDPTKMAEEFAKIASQYQVPGLDPKAVLDTQRKNLDALSAANKAAFEGMQSVAKKQAELLQTAMDEAAGAVKELAVSETPQDAAAKQAELFKGAYEAALKNMKQLADMVSKSNDQATKVINKRFSESLDEIKDQVLKTK